MRTGRRRRFMTSQKRLATEHAVFDDIGTWRPGAGGGERSRALLMSNIHGGAPGGSAQAAMNDPAKRALLAKKEELEQKIDALKYQKAAMEPEDYKTAVDRGAGGVGQGAGGAGQMKRVAILVSSCWLGCGWCGRACCRARGLLGAAQARAWRRGADLLRGADAKRRCVYARGGILGTGENGSRRTSSSDWPRSRRTARLSTRCAGACCCMSGSTMPMRRICFARRWSKDPNECRRRIWDWRLVYAEGFDGKAAVVCDEGDRARSEAGRGARAAGGPCACE